MFYLVEGSFVLALLFCGVQKFSRLNVNVLKYNCFIIEKNKTSFHYLVRVPVLQYASLYGLAWNMLAEFAS